MANEEHLKILKQGAQVWNRWREDNPEIKPDLSEARLKRLYLEGVNLSFSDLSKAFIHGCVFASADFKEVRMVQTLFNKVILIEANIELTFIVSTNFNNSFLERANLAHIQLIGSRFYDTELKGADFSDSLMAVNTFSNIDLSLAKGLESITHFKPSSIDIDTLYKSAGKIPEEFLRGCGVPDDFITFIPSHFSLQQAIQFYSCFISYSTKDVEFARRLYSRMRDEHLRVWFAPEDIKGGRKLYDQIEQAIQLHDRLLIILSEESMQSEWVLSEIRRARKVEIEQKRRKLFPIRLVDFEAIKNWERFDADSGMDIAAEVRSYFIPDFSDWKNHDSFEKGFARLLRDLKAEESRQGLELTY